MKRTAGAMLLLLATTALFAQQDEVRWKSIVGVITAPGISNTVAGIMSGALPWTTTRGAARVNLNTGDIAFKVEGLVLNGGNASGTPDGIASVKGTLVCNAGTAAQAVLDTAAVPLSPQGDAEFSGNLGSVPTPCANPLFLVRIAAGPPAGRWIATGAVRSTDDSER
jgi:hypothetical protein